MNQNKQKSSVMGVKIKCPRFSECPLCYGCRNYSTSHAECAVCGSDMKKNVCNTSLHLSKTISNFITKNRVEIDSL